jgi:hypothetical protein
MPVIWRIGPWDISVRPGQSNGNIDISAIAGTVFEAGAKENPLQIESIHRRQVTFRFHETAKGGIAAVLLRRNSLCGPA